MTYSVSLEQRVCLRDECAADCNGVELQHLPVAGLCLP